MFVTNQSQLLKTGPQMRRKRRMQVQTQGNTHVKCRDPNVSPRANARIKKIFNSHGSLHLLLKQAKRKRKVMITIPAPCHLGWSWNQYGVGLSRHFDDSNCACVPSLHEHRVAFYVWMLWLGLTLHFPLRLRVPVDQACDLCNCMNWMH